MVNGAFFVPSGLGLSAQYAKASSVEPISAGLINQLTMNAGVIGGPRYTLLTPPSLLLTLLYKPTTENNCQGNCLMDGYFRLYPFFELLTYPLNSSYLLSILFELFALGQVVFAGIHCTFFIIHFCFLSSTMTWDFAKLTLSCNIKQRRMLFLILEVESEYVTQSGSFHRFTWWKQGLGI